mmetsp:Transcript_13676/g.39855  ORF Transcript_13676/g.39855 Transcript_13676/m.39855 type:complete len:266 (-) Transcript_13676:990-1787(-)
MCQIINLFVEGSTNRGLVLVAHFKHNVGGALDHFEDSAIGTPQGRLRAFLERAERGILELREGVQRTLVYGVEHQSIQCVFRRLLPLGRKGGVLEHFLLRDVWCVARVVLEHHLVQGEGASFVGAEHVHACQLLDGSKLGDDGLLVREALGPNSHGCRRYHRQGDRNRSNDQHHRERQGLEKWLFLDEQEDKTDRHDDQRDGDHGLHDGQQNFLEMGDLFHGLDQRGSLAEERVDPRRRDDRLNFAMDYVRAHFCNVAFIERHRE